MSCPACGSTNILPYDSEIYECKDCGHQIHKNIYKQVKEQLHGKCKIIGRQYTKDSYGINKQMEKLIDGSTIYKYRTKILLDNHGNKSVAYDIAGWVWNKKDLLIVNENGEDINEFLIPEPVKFDANCLDL